MKNIYKLTFLAFLLLGLTSSCEDGDLPIDTLLSEVDTTSGAVLRFLGFPPNFVGLSGESIPNVLDFTMEVQEGDGSFTPDFKEVRVYLTVFKNAAADDPILDVDGNEFPEILLRTISAAEFDEISSNGLPSNLFSMASQEVLDLYSTANLPNNVFTYHRFELEMNNGQVWNEINAGGALTGGYFNAPYFKITAIRQNL